MIDAKIGQSEYKTSPDIKMASVLDFFSESFDNYFSRLKLSFSYEAKSLPENFLKKFEKIDKKYIAKLIAQLAKIFIFKLVEKKDYRNPRLMFLNFLLQDFKKMLAVSSVEKELRYIHSIHCFIVNLIHFDQPEILEHLFEFDFFRKYIKELSGHYFSPFLSEKNMFLHALCRDSVQVVKLFQKAGWKISVEDVKIVIEHHAEKSVKLLLDTNTFSDSEKRSFIRHAITKSNLTIPELIEQGSVKKCFAGFGYSLMNANPFPQSPEKFLFHSMVSFYRFNLDLTKIDAAGQLLKECVINFFKTQNSSFKIDQNEVGVNIDEGKASFRVYGSQLAPLRGPDDMREVAACYGKDASRSIETERLYALKKLEIARNLVAGKYDQAYLKKNNLPFPDCKAPKNFKYRFKDLLYIVSQELGKDIEIKREHFQSARTDGFGRLIAGRTKIIFNRYAAGYPFIEAMFNIHSPDVLQTETGYCLLHKGRVITEVSINPISQDLKDMDLSFLSNHLSPEEVEEVKVRNKAIFSLDSNELLQDKQSLRILLYRMLKQAKLFRPQKTSAQEAVCVWLGLIYAYHRLPEDDFFRAISFYVVNEIDLATIKSVYADFLAELSLHSLLGGVLCLHGQQSLEEMQEVEELHRKIFDMDSKVPHDSPALFYNKIAQLLSLTGQLTPMKRITGSALEIWLGTVNIFHKLQLLIPKEIQLDLANILLSRFVRQKLFLHLFHPETLSPAAKTYVEKSKENPGIKHLLRKFKLDDTVAPSEEKLEPIVLSDIECVDAFLQQDLVPHDVVDKQGRDLRTWATQAGRSDIIAHLEEKNSPITKLKLSVHASVTFKYLEWGLPPPEAVQPQRKFQATSP